MTNVKKNEFAMWNNPVVRFEDGKWRKAIDRRRVRVMARAEGYAMVRFYKRAPFVVSEKELEDSRE